MTDLDDLRQRVEDFEASNWPSRLLMDALIRDLWRAVEEQTHRPIYLAQHTVIEPVTAEMLADALYGRQEGRDFDGYATNIIAYLGQLYRQRKP